MSGSVPLLRWMAEGYIEAASINRSAHVVQHSVPLELLARHIQSNSLLNSRSFPRYLPSAIVFDELNCGLVILYSRFKQTEEIQNKKHFQPKSSL